MLLRYLVLGLVLLLSPALPAGDTLAQPIVYVHADAGEVMLAWKPTDYPIEEALASNPGTRRVQDLLYTPMHADTGSFTATVRVPEGNHFYYCFWVTKNTSGAYLDFWDTRAGSTVAAGSQAVFRARETPDPPRDRSTGMDFGFGLLFLLAAAITYVLLRLFAGRNADVASTGRRRVMGLGIATALVHLWCRLDVLSLAPGMWRAAPVTTFAKLLAGSRDDLTLIGAAVLLGCLALTGASRARQRRWIVAATTGVFLLLTLSALVNVSVVEYMGGPLTYQWLYYSDFLMAADARSAVGARTSWYTILDLLAYLGFVLLGGRALERAVALLPRRLRPWALPAVLIGLLLLSAGAAATVSLAKRGSLTANPVTAFVASTLGANRPTAFGMRKLPPDALPFRELVDTLAAPEAYFRPDDRVRNLVVIVLESTGAEYFKAYPGPDGPGGPLAPYADQSLSFTNTYAHAPSTNYTMVSLLSGIYPQLSYESITQEHTDLRFPSLPSQLKAEGYRTSFFTAADLNWQRSMEYLRNREFDLVQDYTGIPCARQYRLDAAEYEESSGVDDLCLADRLREWVGEEPGRPFFSMLWTVQAHYPYYYTGREGDFGVADFYLNRYLNAARHGTELAARVLEDLRASGLDSTTLVVVTGDHGEAFGQHGHQGHGNTLYEESMKVPLYLINPLLFRGGTYAALNGSKDLPATLLPLLGQPVPESWQGHDLLAVQPRETFFFSPWTQLYFGYRLDDTKYLFNETTGTVEVYDLGGDPQEQNDLATETPAPAIDHARNRLGAWVQHQAAFYERLR